MRKVYASSLLVVALCAAACESNTQFLDAKQGTAIETAVSRGRFEMNCSAVTPSVLSREVVEPAIEGPRAYGIDRVSSALRASFLVGFFFSFDEIVVASFVIDSPLVTIPKRLWDEVQRNMDPAPAVISTLLLLLYVAINVTFTLAWVTRKRAIT